MGRSLIDALDITVPEGVVDHIDDAGGRRIWERCELRALTGDGEVAAKAGVRRGCVTMVGGKSFKWNQLFDFSAAMSARIFTPTYGTVSYTDESVVYTVSEVKSGNMNRIGVASASPKIRMAMVKDHYYAFIASIKPTRTQGFSVSRYGRAIETESSTTIWGKATSLGTVSAGIWNTVCVVDKAAYSCGEGSNSADWRIGIHSANDTEVGDTCEFKDIAFLDLTATFGAGNEPTTVDAAIAAYKLLGIDIRQPQGYDAGSIRSAVPESVVTMGKNLLKFDPSDVDRYVEESPVTSTLYGVALRHLAAGNYTVYFDLGVTLTSANYIYSRCLDKDGNTVKTVNLVVGTTIAQSSKKATFTVPEDGAIVVYKATGGNRDAAVQVLGYLAYLGITHDDNGYAPYRDPITRSIPDAVKALPGYGWGVGTAYNSIYRESGKWWYKQEVGEADFGALTYTRVTSGTNPYYRFEVAGRKTATDVMQSVYGGVRFASLSAFSGNPSGTLGASTSNQYLAIRDDNYDTVNALKAALSGKKCYYELDAPVLTDITDMMADFGWEYMVEGDRYEVTEPSGIQVPMEAAYFVRYGTSAWVSTPSLMLEMDQMELTGGEPDNFEEV